MATILSVVIGVTAGYRGGLSDDLLSMLANFFLVLPALPENLVATPTLVWLLRNRTDRPQRIEVSYLTGGITWKADYVLLLGAADRLASGPDAQKSGCCWYRGAACLGAVLLCAVG